jgi:PPOX class probable F420-dependent enzyme
VDARSEFMDPKAKAFLEKTGAAAMITLKKDGTPHAVRCGIALVDGRLWSSGTTERARTRHLRRDPRATLFVWNSKDPALSYFYLGLETTVTILDGPEVPDLSIRLFKAMQGIAPEDDSSKLKWFGKELGYDDFRRQMVDEGRIIYEFEVKRTYGMY